MNSTLFGPFVLTIVAAYGFMMGDIFGGTTSSIAAGVQWFLALRAWNREIEDERRDPS